MSDILIDSNVILDILTEDPRWLDWSAGQIEALGESHALVINPIIYSEISIRFERIEALEATLNHTGFRRDPLPWEAAFLAGKCYLRYRRKGGKKTSALPDFFIGAHAAVTGMPLLTRDTRRYRHYFPKLELIFP